MDKGAALADGLAFARKEGYSHAVTMDGDGQHLASDLPKLVEAVLRNPDAFVIGNRELTVVESVLRVEYCGLIQIFGLGKQDNEFP